MVCQKKINTKILHLYTTDKIMCTPSLRFIVVTNLLYTTCFLFNDVKVHVTKRVLTPKEITQSSTSSGIVGTGS